jgi:hypothetical protein
MQGKFWILTVSIWKGMKLREYWKPFPRGILSAEYSTISVYKNDWEDRAVNEQHINQYKEQYEKLEKQRHRERKKQKGRKK